MLAMDYRGPYRVRATHKPDPQIEHPGDAIVRLTRSCICGSDLHLYHGLVPDTRVGTTFGHEFVGVAEAVGEGVQKLKLGDHVLVPFNIFCGPCFFYDRDLNGNCHNTNPEASAVLGHQFGAQGRQCVDRGVYGPTFNAVPIGNALNKGLTLRMNQASVKRHLPRLIEHIQAGRISPRGIITHRVPLEQVADTYHIFSSKLDNCIKTILIPPSADQVRAVSASVLH